MGSDRVVKAGMSLLLLKNVSCEGAQSNCRAKATTATLRRRLITVPARIALSARRLTLHLPTSPPDTPPIGGSGLNSGWAAEVMGDAGPKLRGLSPGNRPGTVEPAGSGTLGQSWVLSRQHHRVSP